ncbi:acyloxyacyl hydrolase [Neolewinella antarctica]|uniref:Acyloxyacyl hydrolase n=1 Tax=Neolewinella antarctica TaxID=442734 RepID=A0ABX0XF29_9BACT|nr:acyloxyacyl hydrolase [Neolewinella antarctica]NJC27514.1 hypothetical protein [Neolewinella antarctica]
MHCPLAIALLLLITPPNLSAQDTWLFTGEGQWGQVMMTDGFVKGDNLRGQPLNDYAAASLKVARQKGRSRPWERRYLDPICGFGVSWLRLESPEEMGSPLAVYRYFRAPFFRRRGLSFDYHAELGVSFGWAPYNFTTNPHNEVVGTHVAAYARLGLGLNWVLSDHFSLQTDFKISHASNGNLRRPNAGLNVMALAVGLTYRLARPVDLKQATSGTELVRTEVPLREREEWRISVYGGLDKHLYELPGLNPEEKYEALGFGLGGATIGYSRGVSPKSRIGVGATALYHSGATARPTVHNGALRKSSSAFSGRNLRFSVHPFYELVFHRFSATARLEVYFHNYNRDFDGPRIHQKIGLAYRFNQTIYAELVLNARWFSQAKFLEWHVGYAL